jgi:hypothetical protein
MNTFDPQTAGEEFVKRHTARQRKKIEVRNRKVIEEWAPKIKAAREALEAKCRAAGIKYPQCIDDWIALGLACGINPYPRTAGEIMAIACIKKRTAEYRRQLEEPVSNMHPHNPDTPADGTDNGKPRSNAKVGNASTATRKPRGRKPSTEPTEQELKDMTVLQQYEDAKEPPVSDFAAARHKKRSTVSKQLERGRKARQRLESLGVNWREFTD